MKRDPEAVAARYVRRFPDVQFAYPMLFGVPYRTGDMLTGTIVYQRLVLAVALQQAAHALRPSVRMAARMVANRSASRTS